jgi:hypothetical protein
VHAARRRAAWGQWAWPRIAAVFVIVVTPGIIAFAGAQRLFFNGPDGRRAESVIADSAVPRRECSTRRLARCGGDCG